MSRNCYVDNVPFAVRSIFDSERLYWEDEEPSKEYLFCNPEDIIDNGIEAIFEGWISLAETDSAISEELAGTIWTKDHHKIYVVNEHQYSNGGGYDMSVYSDNKESLKAFISDWNNVINGSYKIVKNPILKMWA